MAMTGYKWKVPTWLIVAKRGKCEIKESMIVVFNLV